MEVTSDEVVSKVEALVVEDAELKHRVIAEKVEVSPATVLRILHDHFGMLKVISIRVPKMLTSLQKTGRISCCNEFLNQCGENPTSYIDTVVTEDETRVHFL